MIRPSFTRSQVADLSSVETHMQNLVSRLPEDGATVDLQPLFFNFTIDNSTEFLLGRSVNCQVDPAMQHFSEAWDAAENVLQDRIRLGKLAFLLKDPKFDRSCKIVHDFVDSYIADALRSSSEGPRAGTGTSQSKSSLMMSLTRRYNLLSELSLACHDPIQLRNELLNVLLAARDTTAGLLSSIFYFLARHPEEWRDLAAEVGELQGRIPDYDTLKSMRYLKSVLDESEPGRFILLPPPKQLL